MILLADGFPVEVQGWYAPLLAVAWDGLNAGAGEFVDEQSAKMDAVKKEFKVWSDDISELTDKCAKKTQEAVEELIKTRKKMRSPMRETRREREREKKTKKFRLIRLEKKC